MRIFLTTIHILLLFSFAAAQETTAILCADGVDNDMDGLADCDDPNCISITTDGCDICGAGISFADSVLQYVSGCPLRDPEPEGALGLSDYDGSTTDSPTFTFLGEGGFIKLAFVNNLVSNSGDSNPDIYVFEVGPLVEAMYISLRPADQFTEQVLISQGIPDADSDGFYEIGMIVGATSSIDIDAKVQNQNQGTLIFDAISIMDLDDIDCGNSTSPGADIDAVCALSFLPVDCLGIVNGTALVDECGECLEPDDPDFNQSCLDCTGITNGPALIDVCGECLEPDDPLFNQTCAECDIYIPNVFSPNGDGVNDEFRLMTCIESQRVIRIFSIFDRWGNLVLSLTDVMINDKATKWDGSMRGKLVNSGVFIYYVETTDHLGQIEEYIGDVTVLR